MCGYFGGFWDTLEKQKPCNRKDYKAFADLQGHGADDFIGQELQGLRGILSITCQLRGEDFFELVNFFYKFLYVYVGIDLLGERLEGRVTEDDF